MGTVSPAVEAAHGPGWSIRLAGFSDELLARQAGRGSERAFAALYERYHQPLYRYCRSIVRDDADAQDALQSTFARALSALKRQQRNAPLRPWLFRIAHNEAISLIRRRGRDSVAEPDEAGTHVQASAEEEAAERARWAELVDDLAGLPVRLRGALLLRELSGLSHEEIAVTLGGTAGAAKQAIFEARQALAEIAEGRAMECEDVRRRISEGDGRVLRGRRVRAHLRDCTGCEAFAAAIPARQAELRAFAPVLAPAAAALLLRRAIGASYGHGGTGLASSTAAGVSATSSPVAGSSAAAGAAGKVAALALVSKGLAVAAVVATAGVGVAGLARLVDPSHAGSSAATHGGRSAHHGGAAIPGGARGGGSAGRGAGHGPGAGALAGSGHGASGTAAGATAAARGHHGHGAAGSGSAASGASGASGHGHGSAHGSSKGGSASSHGGTNSHGAGKSAPTAKGHSHAGTPASTGHRSGQARGSTQGGKGTPTTPTSSDGSGGGSQAGTSHTAPSNPASSTAGTVSQGKQTVQKAIPGSGSGGS